MSVRVEHGDTLLVIPRLVAEGVVCDAVVTDPPYGLEFMGKEWDAPWQVSSSSALFGKRERATPGWSVTRNANCRKCGGRLRGARKCACAKPDWDEAPNATKLRQMAGFAEWTAEWAGAVYDILRPGGFLVAFGGTRTYHRTACAIEDAGFVIQDCLMWLFATGFPKHRDTLKPAYEPVIVAYKPGGKRTLQVDECRIHAGDALGGDYTVTRLKPGATLKKAGGNWRPEEGGVLYHGHTPPGRWPANICHDGSDEVVALFPASGGQQGDIRGTEPSRPGLNVYGEFGPRKPFSARGKRPGGFGDIGAERGDPMPNGPMYADGGSAARFLFSAKAGAEDRWGSKHPTVKPVDLISWLVKLVTPSGGTFLDPFAGSGTAAVAALKTGRNAILIEREESYYRDIMERVAFYEGGGAHSVQAKHRNRKVDYGPLFAEPLLTPAELDADSIGSYNVAIAAIGEAVKAGAPLPASMLSRRPRR